MSNDGTMRTRRSRPPGFASPPTAPPDPPATTDASGGEATSTSGPAASKEQPAPPRVRKRPPPARQSRDPYAGAATTAFNMRLLQPLHLQYKQLVDDLKQEGFKTDVTELVTALLDAGPSSPDEARELLRSYRRRREA